MQPEPRMSLSTSRWKMATTIIDYFSTLHPGSFSKDVFAHLESASPDLKVISCVSRSAEK